MLIFKTKLIILKLAMSLLKLGAKWEMDQKSLYFNFNIEFMMHLLDVYIPITFHVRRPVMLVNSR